MNIRCQILIKNKETLANILSVLFKHGFVFQKNRIKDINEVLSKYTTVEFIRWDCLIIGYHPCQIQLDVGMNTRNWITLGYPVITIEEFFEKYLKEKKD